MTALPPTVPTDEGVTTRARVPGAGLVADDVHAWFGSRLVLAGISLEFPPSSATALIGPSGCGKSTFLRILNRMHELIHRAALAGEVRLNGKDIYAPGSRPVDIRSKIGMVFQKPNPFVTMSIAENVLAGFRLTGRRLSRDEREAVVEDGLTRAGLWAEVKDRLKDPSGSLSGGQQQRLCIARALAVQPEVLLMDEPCSALDPSSTRRVEETIRLLTGSVTVVIVTHNMQQAHRVADTTAFFLADEGPGQIVEWGPTAELFSAPNDPRTEDYIEGRFG